MKKIFIIFLLLCFSANANVNFLTKKTFNNKISKGIVVIEFWADWNDKNKFDKLEQLNDCSVYRVCISNCKDIASEYKITAIPTVVIFDNGEEIIRFNPNIMFQLDADKKEVQSAINEIVLNKFQ